VKVVPSNSKYKVYIIDEVHMLTVAAFNALLLTLEEPPSHAVFILATTDIQNVPITILSRCQRFDFKPINKTAIIHRLKYICELESIKITDEALEEIALISAGGMRDALGMLDQLANSDEEITLDSVSSYFGSVSPQKIQELIESIAGNNVETVVDILGNIRETGTNYSVFVEKLIHELRKVGISIKSGRSKINISFDTVYNLIFDLNECLCNININIDPYILIEIVLLKHTNLAGNNYNHQSVDLGNKVEKSESFSNSSSDSNTGEVSNRSNSLTIFLYSFLPESVTFMYLILESFSLTIFSTNPLFSREERNSLDVDRLMLNSS
jgi:DNA polymerase-3 subunit gamma/tau